MATAAFLLLAYMLLPSSASAQGAPVGCGYGTGGPNASNLCWLDMAGYNDALARSPTGQPMSVTLPGGYTATFTVTSRPVPGAAQYPAVESRTVPLEQRFAFGTAGYVGVPGRPSLYGFDAGNDNGVVLTLSNISVVDSASVPVTGYSFVIADTENNIAGESFTWTSNTPLELVSILNPTSPRGCRNGITGLGTTAVTCIGQGASSPPAGTPFPWYDDVVVGADTPSTIGLSMRTFARSGVAFAIMTSKIEVTKQVQGRVRASDSFDVAARSPEGSPIQSASTGSTNSATTGELTVLPRTDGSSYTLGESATPGSGALLSDYSQSWSCTNNGAADPSLPSGPGTSVAVSPDAGDHIACTVTNTQLPADLNIAKSASPSPAVPGTNETYSLVVRNNGASRATNVRVSDRLPSGLTFVSASSGCGEAGGTVSCTSHSLDAGASRTFTVTAKVASSVGSCTEIANSATVTSDTPDSDTSNNSATVCPRLAGRTDLAISKTASDTELPLGGGQVMYTLVVKNSGPSDATGVTVTDPMAPGLAVASADPSQGSCTTTAGRLSCDLGRLADGGSAQVLVTANASGMPGSIVNTATVSGAQRETDPDDNTASARVTVPASPPGPQAPFDLSVSKKANDTKATFGQRVRYTVTVKNKGSAPAPGARLTDTLNAPARMVSVKTTAGRCGRRIPLRCSLGTIKAGAGVKITIIAEPKQVGCRQRNAASATGAGKDANPADNLDTVAICAGKAELRLSKVAGRSTVTAGGLISYAIRVSNPTQGTARNVRTCDRLPAGLVYAGSKPKATLRRGRWCWHAKALGPRKAKRYRVTVRALRGAGGAKVNRATTSSPQARAAAAKRRVQVLGRQIGPGGVTG